MYSDSALGTLGWVEYVLFEQVLTGSGTQVYPLVAKSVQRQPMFSFPQSTQQGPIDRPSIDPRLSYTSLLNDLTGGLGYRAVAPTDSLTRYFWGSLETRFKGYVTLPQQTTALTATALGTPNAQSLVVTLGVDVPSGVNAGHHFVYVYDRNFNYTAVGGYFDASPGIPTGPVVDLAINPCWMLGMSSVIVAVDGTTRHIYTSTDGATFTARETTATWSGLVEFDNKVWSLNATEVKLYAAVDPTQGKFVAPSTNPNGWRAMTDELKLYPRELVQDLIVWRDNQGNAAIYIVTTHRLVGVDSESGELITYSRHGLVPDINSTLVTPQYVQWPRDRQLYGIFPFGGSEGQRFVRQYTGTESEVGPAHSGQLSPAYFEQTKVIAASAHHVFVWYTDFLGANSIQGVLAYNEQGGWHPVFTGDPSKIILGGGYDNGHLYTVYSNGTIDDTNLPDSSTPPILLSSQRQALAGNITLAETECGAPGVWKLGAYLYVDARLPTSAPGMPANTGLALHYVADGGADVFAATLGGGSVFPAIVPLPNNDLLHQSGTPFRRLQMTAYLTKSVTTDNSPRLVDIGLYYDLWREQRYAYQFAIDFTDDAWGYPGSLMEGVSREQAVTNLLALQGTRQRFKVTFGAANGQQIVIPAAEILVASRTDMNQHGIFPCTIRDVSAPASG